MKHEHLKRKEKHVYGNRVGNFAQLVTPIVHNNRTDLKHLKLVAKHGETNKSEISKLD
jgi:hypothetical protein